MTGDHRLKFYGSDSILTYLAFFGLLFLQTQALSYSKSAMRMDEYGMYIGTHGDPGSSIVTHVAHFDLEAIGMDVRYVPINTMLMEDRSYPLLPTKRDIAPYDTTLTITGGDDSKGPIGLLHGWTRTSFQLPEAQFFGNPNLVCARQSRSSWIWDRLCKTERDETNLEIVCLCPISHRSTITLLNPGAFCSYPPPSSSLGNFYCEEGRLWVALHNMTGEVYDLYGPVESTKNVTADEVIFYTVSASLTAQCINSSKVTIYLSNQDRINIESGQLTNTTLFKNDNPSCELEDGLSFTVMNQDGPCINGIRTLCVLEPKISPQYLNVTFHVITMTCAGITIPIRPPSGYDDTWWIVLLSVFGGLALIAILVLLIPPIRKRVRNLLDRVA